MISRLEADTSCLDTRNHKFLLQNCRPGKGLLAERNPFQGQGRRVFQFPSQSRFETGKERSHFSSFQPLPHRDKRKQIQSLLRKPNYKGLDKCFPLGTKRCARMSPKSN